MGQALTRGTRIRIISGTLRGQIGTVEAMVFQKSVDFPDDSAMAFQVSLDDGTWFTVRQDQVRRSLP